MFKCHKQLFSNNWIFFSFFSLQFFSVLNKLESASKKCPSTLTATEEMFLVSIYFSCVKCKKKRNEKLAISDIQYWQHFDSMRSTTDVWMKFIIRHTTAHRRKKIVISAERNENWNSHRDSSVIPSLCIYTWSICEHPYRRD